MRKLALLLSAFLCCSCAPLDPPSQEQLLIGEMLETYGHIFSYAMDDAPDAYSFSSTISPSYTWTHTFTILTTPDGSYAHGTDTMGFAGEGVPPSSATFSMRDPHRIGGNLACCVLGDEPGGRQAGLQQLHQ